MRSSFGDRLLHDRGPLLVEQLGPEDEILDRPPERLLLRVPEQRLSSGVPRRNPLIKVERDDRDRADLDQGLDVLLLAAQLFLAAVERVLKLLPRRDVEEKTVVEQR